MKKFFLFFYAAVIALLSFVHTATAQQYKIRQVNEISGMKSESTVYVKGMRKRTESAGLMGMSTPTTIEQCDLQRTIKINDKKKLYFIEPFSKETDEVIDEDAKPVTPAKNKTVPAKENSTTRKGGVITMWYSITDTGERKKMHGLTARHIWTYNKMKPSADACSMKDSFIIKTDGWYIDLPQFNCPVTYRPATSTQATYSKPECQDRYVTRRSGKGKLGFPLTETRTIIMGGKGAQTSEFTTSLETLEFSTAKLDSMLFEIPPGYTLAQSEDELQDKFDVNAMVNQYKNQNNNNDKNNTDPTEQKKPGMIRIGVLAPGGDGLGDVSSLQQYLAGTLNNGTVEAIAVTDEEDARKNNCDYSLTTEFTKIKQASKVGGLLKAIKNTDPNAASSFNMEATLTLKKLADGSVKVQPNVSGKYDGKVDDAARKALDDGSKQVLRGLR